MTKFPIKLKLPTTHVRTLLHLDALKPPSLPTLGKRCFSLRLSLSRTHTSHTDLPLPSRQSVRSAYEVSSTSNSYCIALLNDLPELDAVVVTALDSVPFCCHADLLSMARPELLAVALRLNARLPVALQIDLSPLRPDAYIRTAIELLVGLKRAPPHGQYYPMPADMDIDADANHPPRSRSASFLAAGSPLVSVAEEPDLDFGFDFDFDLDAEEGEGGDTHAARPAKKRKLADAHLDSAPLLFRNESAPRLRRAHTERIELAEPDSPTPSAALRRALSSGAADADASASMHVDPAFITTRRPRRRYRPKRFLAKSSGGGGGARASTSTPKKVVARRLAVPGHDADADISRADPTLTFDQSELTFGLEGLTVAPVSESGSEVSCDMFDAEEGDVTA